MRTPLPEELKNVAAPPVAGPKTQGRTATPNSTAQSLAWSLPITQQGSAGVVQLKEDWNFTPKDYGELTQASGALKFDSDSNWFPTQFKDNLLATLQFTLDPARKKAATSGVSVVDFFHGHVVMKGKASQQMKDRKAEFEYQRDEALEKELGSTTAKLTEKNLPKFEKAMKKSLKSATELLVDAVKEPDVAVVYHTFEYNLPDKMRAGSPERNFLTPLGGKPAPYSAPDIDNASSVYRDYTHLFQFAFLIDQKGVIHVRPGTLSELSTVTGKPEIDRGTK